MKPTGKVNTSVRVVLNRNNKFLVIKRSINDSWSPGKWEFPGGKIDLGQDVNEALKREIREETGIDIEVCQPLFFWDEESELEKYRDKIIMTLYFTCLVPMNAKVVLSVEHDDYKWASLEELRSLKDGLASHTFEVLKRLEKAEY